MLLGMHRLWSELKAFPSRMENRVPCFPGRSPNLPLTSDSSLTKLLT